MEPDAGPAKDGVRAKFATPDHGSTSEELGTVEDISGMLVEVAAVEQELGSADNLHVIVKEELGATDIMFGTVKEDLVAADILVGTVEEELEATDILVGTVEEELVAAEESGMAGEELGGTLTNSEPKKKTRKRALNPSTWKANIRKRLHQEGKEYTNASNAKVPAKKVRSQKNCALSCKFKCAQKVTPTEREQCFLDYYKLTQNRKHDYIAMTTECAMKERQTCCESQRKRTFSFKYFLNVESERIRVCKSFYLGTLAISQKPIYNTHFKKNQTTGMPKPDSRGKHAKRGIDLQLKEQVRDHIRSFPVVESHYCRARTERQYLESTLNLSRMYDLYKRKCLEEVSTPVKESFYRFIFNSEFNISFHIPKSDRCDRCESYQTALDQNLLSQDAESTQKKHIADKTAMRQERQADRDAKNTLVVCFDLQNVINCPRAEISSFFYKRKLNLYNLTAHSSISKKGYCAIWTEGMSGRGANDIASAFVKILDQIILDHPDATSIITWSDSCVPQNRNSIMAFAMAEYLTRNTKIHQITMKYSTPGHSAVQEVDNMHSQIEKAMALSEFYSPVSFLRLLLKVNRNNPYRVIQMRESDFFDFHACSKMFKYKQVPFSEVCQLGFDQCPYKLSYKKSHAAHASEVTLDIRGPSKTRKLAPTCTLPKPRRLPKQGCIPESKMKDLESMFRFMPQTDREYYCAMIK